MEAWDQLRSARSLEDAARLGHREIAAVAEHVTEPRTRDVRVGAPIRHLLRIAVELGAAVRGLCLRGQKRDFDTRQVAALAESLQDARRLELALAVEVIAGLGLY